mmetsp:Transcript_84092/g.228361  ORF Transcript_84092/g.228361 Transcript_84092/m.228361 type:complete len:235 (+) Transcript_84092:81-785(+)
MLSIRARARRLQAWSGRGGSASLLCHRQEELELRRQLLLAIETVGEVDPANAAIRVELHTERLDVVRAVRAAREVGQVELNLVPAFIQPHRHGADEGFHACGALVIRCAETPAHLFVVQHGDLEREILLQVLDDHHQERQLDAQGLAGVCGASHVGRADVGPHDLENARLDIGIGQALDVAVADLLIPNLQWLAADGVQDGQEARLVRVLEHVPGQTTQRPPGRGVVGGRASPS